MNSYFTPSAAVLLVASLLAACSPSASLKMMESNRPRDTNPPVLEGNIQKLVDGNNSFALEMYDSLRSENGNLILSPYSISLALAMTYAGARGETESQMADTLRFGPAQDQLHSSFNALDLALQQQPLNLEEDQQPMQLNIANAVWAEETYPFLQEFLDTIAVNYGAGIHLADFIREFEAARNDINAWVSEKTEDKINDLLPGGILNSYTRMVLVNAIYFKADWLAQFDPESTHEAPFHLLDGSEIAVETMQDGKYLSYLRGNGYQAVELAYVGETAAMDLLVPDTGNFEVFESSLSRESLEEILSGMQPRSVQLGLPKFSFTKDLNLSDTLKGMGMLDAFDSDRADFSGMTGGKDLYISDVLHKAFIAVDEKGTEATAATAVIMETTSAPLFDIVFQVDRPFIFVIRDTVNGQILFIGRVLNPSQSE